MLPISEIKAAGYNTAISSEMANAIKAWGEAYVNRSPWLTADYEKNISSLELPAGIAAEISRLILYKGKSWIKGAGGAESSARSEWLQTAYSAFMKGIRQELEAACAVGGMVFKPYISGGTVHIDAIANDCFIPCAFDMEGNITEAVFLSPAVVGSRYYTRLEHHKWDPADSSYVISNRAFVSGSANSLGTETELSAVPQWAGIERERRFKCVSQPLFAHFRLPVANNVDRQSVMGISCYARAMRQIQQADEQWERIMWEFQGSELAVMAENGMFRIVRGEAELPKGHERLYRVFADSDRGSPLETFSPGIRDMSLFNGLNRIFQRIEFNCGLAYGTISDPQVVEKTAEEVRAGRQRSLTHIQNIQAALEDTLLRLISAMDIYADIIGVPGGDYEAIFEWGDGVTYDREAEFARRMQLAAAGKYKWEKLLAWYFGCSEEKAAEMIPEALPLFGGDTNAYAGLL